jgi:acetylglutamate kinase
MTNTGNIGVVEVAEHEDGSATYHFDLDEEAAKVAQELGLKLMLYCGFSGVSVEDAFKSILDRADYLNQEPDLLNRFDEYGHYGENNPPVTGGKDE